MRPTLACIIIALLAGCGAEREAANVKPDRTYQNIRSDRDVVLNKVIADVLENPQLEDERVQYSSKASRSVGLVDNKTFQLLWPKDFRPSLQGYSFCTVEEGGKRDKNSPALLGIRLDKLDLTELNIHPFNGNVEVSVLNAGGQKGIENFVLGGTRIYYLAKHTDGGWSVELLAIRK
jgi:hypothetical protein